MDKQPQYAVTVSLGSGKEGQNRLEAWQKASKGFRSLSEFVRSVVDKEAGV